MDSTLSEEDVLLVINHAKLVLLTQLNVLHVLIILLVQMEDVSLHAHQDNILTLFQKHADNVLQLVLHAAHNNFV
jgi:hypothetical protein